MRELVHTMSPDEEEHWVPTDGLSQFDWRGIHLKWILAHESQVQDHLYGFDPINENKITHKTNGE